MTAFAIAHAIWIKLGIGVTVLLALLAWQQAAPVRKDASLARWRVNLGVIAVATLFNALLLPLGLVVVALWAQLRGYGVFNQFAIPLSLELMLALVVLDCAIYWQHRAFHAWPLIWRAHRVHHSDTGFDTSLGLRFHPFEIVLSTLFKMALIVALGIAPFAVLAYEIVLLAMSLFSHADVALSPRLERTMRWLIITPDWHRVHHSTHRAETDSNFGNWLSIWDRMFGTSIEQPRDGHRGMHIGLDAFRDSAEQTLRASLWQPLRSGPASVAENTDA